jgi:uncharacterized protein CbrC (UPF0167 family)
MTFTVKVWKFENGISAIPQVVSSCDNCRMNMSYSYGGQFYDIFRWISEHKCPTVLASFDIPKIEKEVL